MPEDTARRAEELITAKIHQDAARPVARQALGAETGRWGRIVALRVPVLRELAFYNKARGVNEDDLPHLDAASGFFTLAGVVPTLEVWAGDASERLGAALTRRGLRPGAVTAAMHRYLDGSRRPAAPAPGSVTVEELDPADDSDHLATLLGGYGLGRARPEQQSMLGAEHDPATVRRYVARVDGRAAAAASLYLHPGGALLSGAATLTEYRRHGCQSALIARRLADAAVLTDLAVVTVSPGSASQANLERAGFRVTHTRTAWRPPLRPAAR